MKGMSLMSMRKVLIPLEISQRSDEILPVIRRLFDPADTLLTLAYVAQPIDLSVISDCCVTGMPIAAYTWAILPEEWETQRRDLKTKLDLMAVELRNAGYLVSTTVLVGPTVSALADFAKRHRYDLVAMATQAQSGLDRLLHGSVAEQLLRSVNIPVLLLRPPCALTEQHPSAGKRMLTRWFGWRRLAADPEPA
jgi:nucleotide-binding universal stress UspA family protein